MRYRELLEGKWWDDGETITLYHGTSSAILDAIQEHGMKPPENLREYAREILRYYLPEEEWTPELLHMIDQRAARVDYGRAGDRGSALYFKTNRDGVVQYAQSLARHGGEIASDVHYWYAVHVSGGREHMVTPIDIAKFPHRFPEGKPIIIEVEVPKSWCMFDDDFTEMKKNIDQAREQELEWAEGPLEEVYDEIFEDREVRVLRTIPPSMIKSISHL